MVKHMWMNRMCGAITMAVALAGAALSQGQGLLPSYPQFAQYQKATQARTGELFKSGAINVTWTDGGKGFDYQWDGKAYHFDFATGKSSDTGAAPAADPAAGRGAAGGRGGRGGGRGGRGGGGGAAIGLGGAIPGPVTQHPQVTTVQSPDGQSTGEVIDNNLFIRTAAGQTQVTTDGDVKKRIRNGQSTIVYGEELGMGPGMWWSPNNQKLAFYRFDESKNPDYTVITRQTTQYNQTEIDSYTKPGITSPVVDLFVYDVASKKTVPVDVRSGKPFSDTTVGYYVYRLYWMQDNSELLFTRMNRRQNTLEFCAANPETGAVRVIVHEEWLPTWVDWIPGIDFMPDHKRFIFTSERNGFKNYYLYDLSGKLIAPLTQLNADVTSIVKVDEAAGFFYYMARDGDNHMLLQFHRCKMDGTGDVRLTDTAFNHSVTLAPDNEHFVDVYQTAAMPPATRVVDMSGKVVTELAKGNMDRMNELKIKPAELFTFKTIDGTAELHGMLNFPSNFDPSKKYPLLVSVYAGPTTSAARETFGASNATTEYGFLVASFDSRSLAGRGRKFSDPFYTHLGIIEMDDQAAGVMELAKRPYVDKDNVGVYGTSYGGTSAATLLMRYPNVFKAASSSSPVTDYRNYNSVYGERYEGLVADNKAGYDAAAVMTYVPNLKGKLLLYFGTADTNVHNDNSLQLIVALQQARKNFELQIGPDKGHTSVDNARMMEFFIDNLMAK